jgi:signal transduction histidine kinase
MNASSVDDRHRDCKCPPYSCHSIATKILTNNVGKTNMKYVNTVRRLTNHLLLTFLLTLGIGWYAKGVAEEPALQFILINSGSQQFETQPNKAISLGANAPLDITFGLAPDASISALGFRYKLEGFDANWKYCHESMRLELRFIDKNQRTIGGVPFEMNGISTGWTRAEKTRRFHHRAESFAVPQEAVRMNVTLFSGGQPAVTGMVMIDNLKLFGPLQDKSDRELIWSDDFEQGNQLDDPLGNPHDWHREGSLVNLATVAPSLPNSDTPGHAILIHDTDPNRFGAWHYSPGVIFSDTAAIQAGCTMKLEWDELFYNMTTASQTIQYSALPVGNYKFSLEATGELGLPTGTSLSFDIETLPPFWKTAPFLWSCGLAVVLSSMGVVRWLAWRRVRNEIARLESQRMLEAERTRIARDLHDDIGANLVQIALLSELAQRDWEEEAVAKQHIENIFSTAKGFARKLDEIVWAIDPQHDSLEDVANYFCKYAQEFLETADIACRFDIPELLPEVQVDSRIRHHLFLVIKEALNNVVKHSQANEVHFRMHFAQEQLLISIDDNGRGLSNDSQNSSGNGLKNMRSRLEQIGGQCTISSEPNRGASVSFSLELKDSRN